MSVVFAATAANAAAYKVYAADELSVELVYAIRANGDMYYIGEEFPSYSVRIQNSGTEKNGATLTCKLKDYAGNVVSSKSKTLTLGKNSITVIPAELEEQTDAGIYTVEASVIAGNSTAGDNEKFSYVRKNNLKNFDLGLSCHFGMNIREKADVSVKPITAGGFGIIRDEIYWADVEKTKGSYTVPEYDENYVKTFAENGTKILIALDYSNTLYDSTGFPKTDSSIEAYANYCAFMAEHFKGKIDYFEIWNEPCYESFTGGSAISGADYAKLLKAAYTAIKKVNKEATVVGCALGAVNKGTVNTFFSDILKAGGGEYMDAMSFHPYIDTGMYCDETSVENHRVEKQLSAVQKILADNNLQNMPIWITEVGTSSNTSAAGYTEEEQAVNLIRYITLLKSEEHVEKVFIYNFKAKGTDASDKEANYGVLDNNYRAKPAYMSLSFLNSIMAGAVPSADNSLSSDNCVVKSFKTDDKDIAVIWTKNDSTCNLNASSGDEFSVCLSGTNAAVTYNANKTAKLYDMYGNEIDSLSYTVDEKPIYVVCGNNNSGVTIKNADGKITVTGSSAKPESELTIVVKKENDMFKNIYYLNQITSDKAGNYSFEFMPEKGDIYKLYVYNGVLKTDNNIGNSDYDISVDFYSNDTVLKNISEINAGDTIRAVVTIKPKGTVSENMVFYGVVFSDEGQMKNTSFEKIKWNNGVGTAQSEYKITSIEELTGMKYMLWNEMMMPIMNAVRGKK